MMCASKPGPGSPLSMGMAGLTAEIMAGPMAAGAAAADAAAAAADVTGGMAGVGACWSGTAVWDASAFMVVPAGNGSVVVSAEALRAHDRQRYLWVQCCHTK